ENPDVKVCGDVSLYWMMDLMFNTMKAQLYKLGFSRTFSILNEENQIFGNMHHIENGHFVPACTCVCVLKNPDATLDDLMEYIKGPDFPTKGIIMGRSGIRQAYATGRGRIVVRARTEFEETADHRNRIIVTELPYQVNKRMLVKAIAEQVKDKRLEGISDLREESDRNGMRVVIELKRDANPQIVLNHLFAQTAMQSSFSVIMLALVDDQRQPKILSLRHMIDEYIKFQEELLVRRTKYDLKKALERAHLLEGLLIAQDNIDEVIHIIRTSYDDAKQKLMDRFGLDDIQTQAILDMRLKALQGLDREKLKGEYDELEGKIAYYRELLASDEMLRGVLIDELTAIRDKYGDERRTEIQDVEEEIDLEDLIEKHECVITMTESGYIKRVPADVYSAQHRGGKGIIGMATKEEDIVRDVMVVNSHSILLMFTNLGRVYAKKAYCIPEASRTSKGTNAVNIIELGKDEKITSIISVHGFEEDEYFVMVTKYGVIKRANVKDFEYQRKGGKIAINLDEGDELLFVKHTTGESDVVIATRNGRMARFNEGEARVMGRTARGVRGIKLKGDDYVVGTEIVDDEKKLVTVTEKGYGKRSAFDCFMAHARGTTGIICHKITDKTGCLSGIAAVDDTDDIMIITDAGTIIRTPVAGINVFGSNTSGVKVMRIEGDTRIVNFTVVKQTGEETENAEDVGEETETETDVTGDSFNS
ncbi:MAG: DNA gyrase subunit A, partial [Clostridia bacterium]|nr:DNA gyrase subunit A [Clostridia bacterium]